MDSRTGKKIRLGRILPPPTGHGVVVAASHGVMGGPPAGLRTRDDIDRTFTQLDLADAVMVNPGMLPLVEDRFVGRCAPGLVLHLDWKNHNRKIYQPGTDGRSEGVLAQLATLDEVAAAGFDAVMTYLYVGHRDSRLERDEIERNARIVRDCERLGLVVIIEPRSALEAEGPDATGADVMSLYCRIASDIGADIVKVVWPSGGADDFAQIVDSCLAPVLLAGGPGGDDIESTSDLATQAMFAGAVGVMFGRRVFRADKPAEVLSVLRGIVHGKHDPLG